MTRNRDDNANAGELEIAQWHLRDANLLKGRQIAEYASEIARLNALPWRRFHNWLGHRLNDVRDLFNRRSAEKRADGTDYTRWIKLYDTLSNADRSAIKAHIDSLGFQPLISILLPISRIPEHVLRAVINSVRAQLYPRWQLCLANDGSAGAAIEELLREMATADARINLARVEANGGLSAADNSALNLAKGEFVALLNGNARLSERALYEFVAELNAYPDADLIYSDEDLTNANGVRHTPYFRTDWNWEDFLARNTVPQICILRKTVVDRIGGFRSTCEGARDYDLVLRVADATEPAKIRHVAAILSHALSDVSRAPTSPDVLAARAAKADHFRRRGEAATPVENPYSPRHDWIRRAVPTPVPLVSLIVPTRNRHDLLGPCLEGLLTQTNYDPLQVLIIDHESDEPETITLLERWRNDPRVKIMRYEGPFNYSDMNNRAVAIAQGEFVGLINNDISIIHADWLAEMISLAVLPGSGAIGAKLLYPDDTVQHGGVVLGIMGVANHAHYKAPRHALGYFDKLVLTSDISAVTGACLIVRRTIYEEVGGLDAANLPVSFNDVDLCLKIQARGYRNIWTPFACLYHHESPSRGSDMAPDKVERAAREAMFMRAKWVPHLDREPFYNINLTLKGCDFALAFPPRRVKPWLANRDAERL